MKDRVELLWQGDCLDWLPKIPDECVDLVLVDPPYGTTACKWDAVIPFEPMWEQLKRVTQPNAAIAFCAGQPFTSALVMSKPKWFKYCWVWKKNKKTGHLNAKKRPMLGHEDIIIFCKGSTEYNPQKRQRTTERKAGNKANSKSNSVYGTEGESFQDSQSDWLNPDTVLSKIDCVHNSSDRFHPTQKPVELMEYMIRTYTNEGEVVLDFTMGSGTTGIAAKKIDRHFIGIEKDPKYFEIAKKRIAETKY